MISILLAYNHLKLILTFFLFLYYLSLLYLFSEVCNVSTVAAMYKPHTDLKRGVLSWLQPHS